MRKIKYSAGVKGIILSLMEVFSIILVICMILVANLLDRNMLEFGDLKNKNFLESGSYEKLFRDETDKIFQYIEYKKQFETDGEYNPAKAVNILAYHNNSVPIEISPVLLEGEKFRYYLADLENWSKNYEYTDCTVDTTLYLATEGHVRQFQQVYVDGTLIYEKDMPIENLKEVDSSLLEMIVAQVKQQYGANYSLEEYHPGYTNQRDSIIYSEVDMEEVDTEPFDFSEDSQTEPIILQIMEGKLFELNGWELQIILGDMGFLDQTVTVGSKVLIESCETVEGSTILDEFINDNITASEMMQAYGALDYTLSNIGKEITAYKRLVNRYENGNTNLQFQIYSEEDNRFYSNMEEILRNDKVITSQSKLLALGEELGSYFYYNEDAIHLTSTVEGMEDYFYQTIDPIDNGQYTEIFIGIDTEFVQKDNLREVQDEYNRLQPWAVSSLVAAGISFLGCFFCFIYLSIVAGRRPEDEEIHTNWFDKIKTEILIFMCAVFCFGSAIVLRELVDIFEAMDVISSMILAGTVTFFEITGIMVFYLSFVRRMKAGIMWRGSILCWVVKGVKKVIRNWNPSLKIMVACGIHLVLTLILGYMVYWFSGREVVLAVVLYLLLFGIEAVTLLREGVQRNQIMAGIKRIAGEDIDYKIDTSELTGSNKAMGETINTIGEGLYRAVDENMKNERLKTDLITNVSHDIKTPLTSIINYVDLLKREDLDNQKAKDYIGILDAKSQRLKQLTEDLVEASKISSGNISLQMERINLVELVHQTSGEFSEKFEKKGLTAIMKLPKEPVIIMADGRRIWRVIENLYNNVAKYALGNTRVYVDMEVLETAASFSIKNISEYPLNIDASELTERFIRGDVSRSTEGSGLGLSIAQNLTQLMGGTFNIYLDGDLFKVTVTFPVVTEKEK